MAGDVTAALRRLKSLEEDQRDAQRNVDRAQGELDAGMRVLNELGYKTLDAGQAAAEKMRKRLDAMEAELVEEVQALEAICSPDA